jgi:hypothetical protein
MIASHYKRLHQLAVCLPKGCEEALRLVQGYVGSLHQLA